MCFFTFLPKDVVIRPNDCLYDVLKSWFFLYTNMKKGGVIRLELKDDYRISGLAESMEASSLAKRFFMIFSLK